MLKEKNELAGNIHGKGDDCSGLSSNILDLPSRSFSASLVFEQSYGESDGDSASLAIFVC